MQLFHSNDDIWNAVSIHWLEQYSKQTRIFPFIHSRIEHESCDKTKKDGEILEYFVLLFRFWLLTTGNSGSLSSFLLYDPISTAEVRL